MPVVRVVAKAAEYSLNFSEVEVVVVIPRIPELEAKTIDFEELEVKPATKDKRKKMNKLRLNTIYITYQGEVNHFGIGTP
jgi:hypothetical protein